MSSPVTFLTDFSDRISPMLVKELRQGMRAKTFIAVFLSLQIFLGVMLFSAGAASSSDQVGSIISGIIFTFFSIAVMIVQPLRGTSALAAEIKGNTIDMMVLTRLSAWRIVFGKWVAIVGQSALLFATIIPYLILRYFFGGMNLFGEMVFIILLFLTSMALTAVTVGLSGCHSVIIRSLVPIFGLPMLLWTFGALFLFRGFRGSGEFMDMFTLDSSESRWGVAAYIAAITYLGGSMLSLGASLIAPAAENHSVIRRLFALVALLALVPLGIFGQIDEGLIALLITVICIPAIIIALTESAPLVQTVCKPFVKRGLPGKALGWLLYPCWPSGVLYAILIGFLGTLGFFFPSLVDLRANWTHGSGIRWDIEETAVILSLLGGLFFPSVWQVFLFRGEGQRVAHYLLILVGSFVLLGVFTALADSMNSGSFLWFFAWNPLVFTAMIAESRIDDEIVLIGVIVVDLVLFAILLARAFMEMNRYAPVIRETEQSLKEPG
jgi:ABC-type transport system involved in multi-copper enzyme maturation permease subunit